MLVGERVLPADFIAFRVTLCGLLYVCLHTCWFACSDSNASRIHSHPL